MTVLRRVSRQTLSPQLGDEASLLTHPLEETGGRCIIARLGRMSLTCRPDLSNVALLIGGALLLGSPSTIEGFFRVRRGGHGNGEQQVASLARD